MRIIKKYKWIWLIIIGVLIFPFIVRLIYILPYLQIIPVDMSDLIVYYATVFAIPGSFAVLYVTRKMDEEDKIKEQEKQEKKEIDNHKPHFTVSLEKSGSYFNLVINGCGSGKYKDIYFYDNRICDIWTQDQYRYKICFDMDNGKIKKLPTRVINIPDCFSKQDENGYPQEFLIYCEDVKIGALFMCSFKKREDCGKIFYYEESIDIIDWRNS